jgi:hypothetical protein
MSHNPVNSRRVCLRNIISFFSVGLILLFLLPACSAGQPADFTISLAATGEVILSGDDIVAFHSDNNTLELNAAGIQKWNSHLTYSDIPKLNQSLFGQDFILKIKGQEVCQGKFWSWASSSGYAGVKIYESLFKLDSSQNLIWISAGFGGGEKLNPVISAEIANFFTQRQPSH